VIAAVTATGLAAAAPTSLSAGCRPASRSTQSDIEVTVGDNALFGGSCCPARAGYDLATGWGSPLANVVAALWPGPS
jgi:hypothetical protein